MSTVKQRMKKDGEEGFTLIELMVVVLILGILMAIAIPTFLSLTSSAKKTAAQADLTTAVTDAAVVYTANGNYGTGVDDLVGKLQAEDGNINWLGDNSAPATAGNKQVIVNWVSGNEIDLGVLDKNNIYYWVDDNSGTTTYSAASQPGDSSIPSSFPNSSMP